MKALMRAYKTVWKKLFTTSQYFYNKKYHRREYYIGTAVNASINFYYIKYKIENYLISRNLKESKPSFLRESSEGFTKFVTFNKPW